MQFIKASPLAVGELLHLRVLLFLMLILINKLIKKVWINGLYKSLT